MKKIWILLKREYKEAVFKKSFIITTILTPFIMIALGVVPSLLVMMDTEEAYTLHVIDASGLVYDKMTKAMDDSLENGAPRFNFKLVNTNSFNIDEAVKEQKELLGQEAFNGLIFIPETIMDEGVFQYFAQNIANLNLNKRLRNTIGNIIRDERIALSELDPQIIKKITAPISLKTIKVAKGGEESERGFLEEYFGTFVFVLILYMTLIVYGTTIMRGIIQEKTSRIIEILLSSANSFQLMAGKILGLGSVGLTQYIVWALFGISFVLFGDNIAGGATKYVNLEPSIFIYFVVFYILGYFIFASLYAAIGALTNSDQEAQNLSAPVIIILIIPLLMLGFLVKNPNSALVVTLSMIPLFSPIIMFTRINLANPPMIEIIASIGILILTIIFLIWITAKIYRVGILMYGKRPTLPEIMKWMSAK